MRFSGDHRGRPEFGPDHIATSVANMRRIFGSRAVIEADYMRTRMIQKADTVGELVWTEILKSLRGETGRE
jgi:hypothetical protein